MRPHMPTALLTLGCWIGGAATTAQAQACQTSSAIPCVVRWHTFPTVTSRTESYGRAVAIRGNGDVLIPGESRNYLYTDRDVFKFSQEGVQTYGFGIEGIPWYIGANGSDDYVGFPWHKIVLDEGRSRFFVLFAAQNYPIGYGYNYFLAAHSIVTGERLPAWGNTRYVGWSPVLYAGMDIDGSGNAWTVLEVLGAPQGLQLKKWDGNNGTNVSPSNANPATDNFMVFSPQGRYRRLQAFGVRKADNKIFLAYAEDPNDAVVTLWSPVMAFLARVNFVREIPAPASVPPAGLPTDHPYYSDGFVDPAGNLNIAGTYRYERRPWEFDLYYIFPTVLQFGVDAAGTGITQGFQFFEDGHPTTVVSYTAPERFTVRAVGTPNGETFVQPVYAGRYTYLVSTAGTFRDFVFLPTPVVADLGNPGCRYHRTQEESGLRYLANRLVVTGTARKLLNPCGGEDPMAFVISYGRNFILTCCRTLPFRWDFARYEWFWYKMQNPFWPPKPGDPCPRCDQWVRDYKSQEMLPPAVFRDLTLIASTHTTAELPQDPKKRLAQAFGGFETGPMYRDSLRQGLVKALQDTTQSGDRQTGLSQGLQSGLNAALLDLKVRPLSGRGFTGVDTTRTALLDRFSVTWRRGEAPKSVSLAIRNGLPAHPEGYDPVFPMATYRLTASGERTGSDSIEVRINLKGFAVRDESTALHVLEWDGKQYREVTSAFDMSNYSVSARTSRLADYVVMSSRDSAVTTHR